MEIFKVNKANPLKGEVEIGGAKNAALPIMAACLLTEETVVLRNVPDLSDIRFMVEILKQIGAKVENPEPNVWKITAKKITHTTPYELVRNMRASVCLLGPLVGRTRRAEVSIPGGCVIGPRPIDLHIKGLQRLNCKVELSKGYVRVDATNIKANSLFIGGRNGSTVTGTANIVMAAVLAPGITNLEYAACEREGVDLCNLLVKMGAKIKGIGSPSLEITGVQQLHGCNHTVISDRIEAGTFVVAAAITRGDVTVKGIDPKRLSAFLDKLEEAGLPMELGSDSIHILPYENALKPVDVITLPHPGYPTDLQAQMIALMTQAEGISIITERIYPNRFMHVPELQRMGAVISIEGASAIVKGPVRLSGAPVMASDLRASAALVLAGFAAEGETWVQHIYHIDRGYEHFEKKLNAIGADIERLDEEDMPAEFKS